MSYSSKRFADIAMNGAVVGGTLAAPFGVPLDVADLFTPAEPLPRDAVIRAVGSPPRASRPPEQPLRHDCKN